MFKPGMKLPVGLAAGGGATFIMSIFLGWYGFPKFIESQVANTKMLKGGTESRQLWSNFPLPLDFKVYVFNVTNPDEVHGGAKPIVQEVGPYIYEEYKTKENLVDKPENDTVAYNNKARWVFRPDLSGGLTGDELITMPHPLIVGMVGLVERTKPGMLGVLGKALPHIHRQPPHAFMTAPMHQIFFDGVLVNCTVSDFSAKAVCGAMRKDGKDFKWISDNEFVFSFFGHKNNTQDPNRLEVQRGIRDIQELGQMASWKGKPQMEVWRGMPCNALRGTDSTIFPPALKKEDGIVAFAPDLCRSIDAKYVSDTVYQGIPGYAYSANFGDQSSVPEEKCFCPAEDRCMKKGVIDLLACAGSPVVASLPHFYLAHEDYQNGVQGLHPTKEKHEIAMAFEPITGTPLEARKRLQFSLSLSPVAKVPLLATMPTTLVPLFWVEEGLALPTQFVDQLKTSLFRVMKIVDILRWILMAAGVGMGGVGGFLLYKKKQEMTVNSLNTQRATNVASVATINNAMNGMSKF